MLVISIILDAICPFLHIYWYFAFSFKQIFENFQIWRIFTNYLVKPTKRLNIGIIFDIIYLYSHIYKLELEAKYSRQYSKFIFTIFLLVTLNIITTLAFYMIFSATESRSLINELIYSFMAISSYKNPNDKTIVFYLPVKNRYVPIATLFFNISSNKDGDLSSVKKPIIGFISGYIYCFIVEKLKISFVPNFLKRWLGEPVYEYGRKIFRDEKNGHFKEKDREELMNIQKNDSTNVAFRKKESVVDGNEFKGFDKNDINWD